MFRQIDIDDPQPMVYSPVNVLLQFISLPKVSKPQQTEASDWIVQARYHVAPFSLSKGLVSP